MFETGHFPNLLQNVLHALGFYVRPLYDKRRVSEPPRACYYITRVHIRVMDAGDRGFRTLSAHESLTSLSTYAASVSNVARRALCRDGNGALILDSPWGIPPLGDVYGGSFFPYRDVNGENSSPTGKRRW
jgi:hypothetical protein